MNRKQNRIPGIEKRGDTWFARYYDIDGKRRGKRFRTQEEAVSWKSENERSVKRGEWVAPELTDLTFSKWVEIWLGTKSNITAKTRCGYNSNLRQHLLPSFGNIPIKHLTTHRIKEWVAKKVSEDIGSAVLRSSYKLLKQILNDAVFDGRLLKNPAIGIELPKRIQKQRSVLTVKQLFNLSQECKDYDGFVLLAGLTGMRWGEITALIVKDINPLHQSINVNKAFSTDESGKVVITTTKTNQNRVVPIPTKLNPLILELIKDRKPEDLLFTGRKGGILNYGWFMRHIFQPATKKAGVTGIGFHNLRHTCASLLIANGTPITTVSGILGHASTKMTLDVYGHFYEEDSAVWINQVANSFSEVDRYKIGTTERIAISQ